MFHSQPIIFENDPNVYQIQQNLFKTISNQESKAFSSRLISILLPVISAPNYYQLHKINEIANDTKVVVDYSLLLEENSKDASKEIHRILEDLLCHKEFVKAREYARLLQLPEDPITLHEVCIIK